jgi:cell division protein FtsI/penicillin-binding protein 2
MILRLVFVQIVRSEKYSERAMGQYVAGRGESEKRGTIFFTRKDGVLVSAATMVSGYTLVINPKLIKDPELLYKKISEIVPVDRELFFEKVKKVDDPYEEIAFRFNKDQSEKIKELKENSVFTIKSSWRSYPGGSLAAQVLGVVAYVNEYQEGVYGLERQYEEYLAPTHSQIKVNPFAAVFRGIQNPKDKKGLRYNIVTTIDPQIQQSLDKTVLKIQNDYSSAGVGGIVMDPRSGEIVAMSFVPTFDPNDLSSIDDQTIFKNPSVTNVYEFGSVIKPLVIAAGFDAGVINENTTYMDTGSVRVGVETIHNFDKKGRGLVTIKTILGQSLNTGMVMVAEKLGQSSMRTYFEKFGIREKTNIDLPGEGTSLTSNLSSNRPIEFAAASFGQGFAITPVQALRAFSALANKGVPVNPFVVKRIEDESGRVIKEMKPETLDRAISEESARNISIVLTKVVDTDLKNGNLSFPHHSTAAKTGTAQIAKPTGGYYDDRYLHSMFAYIPASDPKYLVFLYNVYPKGVDYASSSLAVPLFEYLRFLIAYGKILPDR